MRMLFLALLLVNLAFFVWEYRHPPTPAPTVAPLEAGVPPVVLLREKAEGSDAAKDTPSAQAVGRQPARAAPSARAAPDPLAPKGPSNGAVPPPPP